MVDPTIAVVLICSVLAMFMAWVQYKDQGHMLDEIERLRNLSTRNDKMIDTLSKALKHEQLKHRFMVAAPLAGSLLTPAGSRLDVLGHMESGFTSLSIFACTDCGATGVLGFDSGRDYKEECGRCNGAGMGWSWNHKDDL